MAMAALQALITKQPTPDCLAGMLADSIQRSRHLDTDDNDWYDSLRVIWTSVEFHSGGQVESRHYLRFIGQHILT